MPRALVFEFTILLHRLLRYFLPWHFSGYWKDVGTISSLWEANMEILDPEHSGINLFDEDWKIYSHDDILRVISLDKGNVLVDRVGSTFVPVRTAGFLVGGQSKLASMGIYIFNWDILKKYLEEDEADPESDNSAFFSLWNFRKSL